jgi:hypothetical protein
VTPIAASNFTAGLFQGAFRFAPDLSDNGGRLNPSDVIRQRMNRTGAETAENDTT